MDIIFLKVKEDGQEKRLDKYLALVQTELSRSYIQKLLEDKRVYVNEQLMKGSYKVKRGDQIRLELPEPSLPEIKPLVIELDIIYEDIDLIVVNKAAGLIVHPVPGNTEYSLVNALMAYTDQLSGINGVKRPGIVHRLDKDTSGVLVVAKNDQSHRALVKQFKNRQTQKIYHAIVKGKLPYQRGKIDAPIGRNPTFRKKMAVISQNSKKAITHFQVLERLGDFTYVEVKIETGRTHQIRVHFSYLGYPVLGDDKYGRNRNQARAPRQMLHAYKLGLYHPGTGNWLEFTAPLPADFKSALLELKKVP